MALLLLISSAMSLHAQTVEYYHTDALGTPVAVTDASGNVVQRSEYAPYGELLNGPVKDGPGYTGHVSDAATQLVYMQQRYYDPEIGRFLSVDPVAAYSDPIGMFNRYKYAANSPYSFKDPDGRQECRSCEMFYGASASVMLTPEQRRVWAAGERAATTTGSGAEEGAAIMDAAKAFAANPQITKEGVAELAAVLVVAKVTHGKGSRYMHGPSPKINAGQQGKHQIGHNNYQPGRSVLTGDPSVLGRSAGTGEQVGKIEVGLPGSKERVNFGENIGTYVDQAGNSSPTTNGIIHYGSNGIHIVPARPDP